MPIDPTGLSERTLLELAKGFAAIGGRKEDEAQMMEAFKTGVGRTRLLHQWVKEGKVREGDFTARSNGKVFWVGEEGFTLSHDEPYPSAYFIARMLFAMKFGKAEDGSTHDGEDAGIDGGG